MRAHSRIASLVVAPLLLAAWPVLAQPRPVRPRGGGHPPPPPMATSLATTPGAASVGLRARFGVDSATRLLRSNDPADRLRGLERAAAIRTPEALAILERAAGATAGVGFDMRTAPEGLARKDPRALLVVVRGLASWIDKEGARDALASLLIAQSLAFTLRVGTTNDPAADDAEGAARVLLARQEAAVALASSGNPLAFEALMTSARAGGPGQDPALEALALHSPPTPLFGGVALTTPATIALAGGSGDLRALDPVQGMLRASDPAVRAAALAALGAAGDARVASAASDAVSDKDPRIRVAAAEALARVGAPGAGPAVEALVADDVTARDGLRIGQLVQGQGVTRAAAARAAASSDPAMRAAAVATLGRQVDPLAVGALATLAGDPLLGGDAADRLARSPSAAAMAAIEAMATAPATRRLAARAYLVRRMVRGERSVRLDALLSSMSAAQDAGERAVAVEALVALGERSPESALSDPDPRVQRGAAMGALGLPAPGADQVRRALNEGIVAVRDEATREVLAFVTGDSGTSTLDLVERAQAGGPAAPLAALALAQRGEDQLEAAVDGLLASRDPVIRAHAARGLGASGARDATGRLARAYTFEADLGVRRALVAALAARSVDAGAPARRDALLLAATLDPDRRVRAIASRAMSGASPLPPAMSREIAWIRIVPAEGTTLASGTTASLVGADGLARPIVFDDDGYALVPGVPPGEAHLRLAPRVSAYDSP